MIMVKVKVRAKTQEKVTMVAREILEIMVIVTKAMLEKVITAREVIIIKEIKAKAGTLGRGMASGITEGRMAVREILEDTTKVAKVKSTLEDIKSEISEATDIHDFKDTTGGP